MEHDGTGCRAPDHPILCINNCGFFGSTSTRNMCSKCHRETVLNEEQSKLATSSIDIIVSRSSSKSSGPFVFNVETKVVIDQVTCDSSVNETSEARKDGPSRCSTCQKRVGFTGFICKCNNMFCSTHRYSEKHDCPYDYRAAAQSAIAKANPVVKAEKLDKI